MAEQNYKNHVRYYFAHHFIFYPIVLLMLFISIWGVLKDTDEKWLWMMVAALTFITGWLSFMVRQHYALITQNRIVRLEMRLRYYQLTQQRLETIEELLTFRQIAALRFAPDNELIALLQRTLKENLSPEDIKRAIIHWQPDYTRV